MLRASIGKITLALLASGLAVAAPVHARTLLKDICRVKGQEQNTLSGMGLVVGLKGTGDGGAYLPALRSLAQAMQLMGNPLGNRGLLELKDAKNVALVMVTATVPAAGGRQGDQVDCVVSSIGAAKSLAGGRLFITPLQGPQVRSPQVYAFAEGPLHLDDPQLPTNGRIYHGCRLEADFHNPFIKDGSLTLVLDEDHADFQVAQDVAELINSQARIESRHGSLARATNQVNIEVSVPAQYADDPVLFVSQNLSLPMPEPQTPASVTINERAGSIVISGDVELGPVVVSHKSIVVETGDIGLEDRFVPLDAAQTGGARLESLVEALNAVKVPTADIIQIIKGLKRNGKLHAELVIE